MSQVQAETQTPLPPEAAHPARSDRENFAGRVRHQVGDYIHDISDGLNTVSERGQHSYQQAAHAAKADGAVLTGLVVGGAIGFATAWLIFARHAVSGEFVAQRMSRSSEYH